MLRLPDSMLGGGRAKIRGAASNPAQEACDRPERDASSEGRIIRAAVCWRGNGLAKSTAPFHMAGSDVAAASFTAAVALRAESTAVDVFVPQTDLDACREQLQSAGAAGGERGPRLSIYSECELPRRLRNSGYHVLHAPTDFPRLGYLRDRFSDRVVPVTGTAMGLSYSFEIHLYYLRILSTQPYACDAIVCPTRSAVSALEKRLLDLADRYTRVWGAPPPELPPLRLIPWAVDTERFAPRSQAVARRDLGLPAERPTLLCVGRMNIHDKMDLAPLMLAFDRLRHTTKERLLLVLAGSHSGYVARALAYASQLGLRDDVRTFVDCPPACLPSLYAASDIVVAPTDSPSETFGLSIAEAMASGRPVVASDWNGYKELIVQGETGFKVRTDWTDCLGEVNDLAPFLPWVQEHLHVGQSVSLDVSQMARYLSSLIRSPELRAEMGRRGRERAESLYSWPVVIAQWEALWSELAAIGRTIQRKEPGRLQYLTPNYFQHFSHYATRIIDDDVPVKLTPRGQAELTTGAPLPVEPLAQGFLRSELLLATLAAIKPAGWIGEGLLVGDLVRLLGKKRRLSRPQILMHLMWLAKYDLVSLGGADAESEVACGDR